jgi:hypothetical protein
LKEQAMADDIRAKAKAYIDQAVPVGQVITSDGGTAGKFKTITGLGHEDLVAAWKTQEGKLIKDKATLTSCNSFVGIYSRSIGLDYLGVFDFAVILKKLKKEHAWVVATADVRPKYGDIVRHKAFHVDIALDFVGDKWNTVDGGQGGPQYGKDEEDDQGRKIVGKLIGGHDIVKRVERTYDATKLQGWVDLELYLGASAQPPTPQQPTDNGATGDLWLNEDGDVIHPDAPDGGGGPGYFRSAGILCGDPFADGLPHPWSPAARYLDPLAIWPSEDRDEA